MQIIFRSQTPVTVLFYSISQILMIIKTKGEKNTAALESIPPGGLVIDRLQSILLPISYLSWFHALLAVASKNIYGYVLRNTDNH